MSSAIPTIAGIERIRCFLQAQDGADASLSMSLLCQVTQHGTSCVWDEDRKASETIVSENL